MRFSFVFIITTIALYLTSCVRNSVEICRTDFGRVVLVDGSDTTAIIFHIADNGDTLSDWRLYMGRVPFFHRIRSLTGKTPAELIRDMRLKHACILLKRTNINMSELATNVGFMTAENFISIFREKFGMTPLEYRLKHRK